MNDIALSRLPPELAAQIRAEAERSGASWEDTVVRLLRNALAAPAGADTARRRDLSDLAGTWTQEDADEFDRNLAEQRRIQPQDWQ